MSSPMSRVDQFTDDDSASVLSASSAASYHRRKLNRPPLPSVMSVSDYSDYSRYPKFTTQTVETEGPGIRMRDRPYDSDEVPQGYTPVTKTTTIVEQVPRRSRQHRRSPSRSRRDATVPIVQHEIQAVANPVSPSGVSPHVVTHVHLKPSRHRRHRSVSREPPPVATRPAYGRRRSRSYDDRHRSQTQIINVPPQPIYPAGQPAMQNPGYMYGPPMRSLPAAPEFGYGRPATSGYAPQPAAAAPNVTIIQPSTSGMAYPSSRRRAMSNAYMPNPSMGSPMSMGGQYSPYGGSPGMGMMQSAPSAAPNVTIIAPSAPTAGGYAGTSQQMYQQSGYGSPMGNTTQPVVINIPQTTGYGGGGGMQQQQQQQQEMMMQQGMGRRARAQSMSQMGSQYGGGGGMYGGGGSNYGGGGSAYGGGSMYGGGQGSANGGSVGYGQSSNGVYGFGPGQVRDPSPQGMPPSPPPMQKPPGTGFFGGLFGGSKHNTYEQGNRYAHQQQQQYPQQMQGGYYN